MGGHRLHYRAALYRVPSRRPLAVFDDARYPIRDVAFHPTRTMVVLGAGSYDGGYLFHGQLIVWDWTQAWSKSLRLEIACGAAKNKFYNLVKVIGIGIDAPKFAGGTNAEDFILMPCENWTDEMRAHYETENEPWRFFGTSQLQQFEERVTQFIPLPHNDAQPVRTGKVGRNGPCPCGSGKKFKKCHG